MDLLLVPYWADTELGLMQWPPFLLASKVCAACQSIFVDLGCWKNVFELLTME